jgi:hypothetical protein
VQFVGKNNKSTRIISAYDPHQPTGIESLDSQHRRYYNSIGLDANHVDALWTDLSPLERKWTEAVESVVILAYWNAEFR